MATEDDIKIRVSAEADDASAQLRRVTDAEQGLAQGATDAGRSLEDAAGKVDARRQSAERLAGALDQQSAADTDAADAAKTTAADAASASQATTQRRTATEELADALAGQEAAEAEAARAAHAGAQVAGEAQQAAGFKQRAVDALNGALAGMVTRWVGALAIGHEIVGFFRDIAAAARDAAAAVVRVGESQRALTANVGAASAKTIFEGVTEVAGQNRFNVQGRAQLLEAVSTLTDLREGLTPAQVVEEARRLASVQRATGVGGSGAARLLLSLQENLGLGAEQAVDFSTVALNSGLTADSLQQIVERAGNVGGMDLVAALIAARSTGLDPNRASRSIPTLVAALTKNDADGNIDPLLAAAGVTADTPIVERLRKLLAARDSGRLSRGQFEEAIGGAEQQRIIAPLERALQRNLLPEARSALSDPQATERTLAELQRNEYVQVQERQNLRDLAAQVRQERSGLTPTGEELADMEAAVRHLPGIVKFLNYVGGLPNLIAPPDPEVGAKLNEQATQVPTGVPAGAATPPPAAPVDADGSVIPAGVRADPGPLSLDWRGSDAVLRRLDEMHRQQRVGIEDMRMSSRPQVIINEMRVFGVDPRFDVRHPLDTLG